MEFADKETKKKLSRKLVIIMCLGFFMGSIFGGFMSPLASTLAKVVASIIFGVVVATVTELFKGSIINIFENRTQKLAFKVANSFILGKIKSIRVGLSNDDTNRIKRDLIEMENLANGNDSATMEGIENV